MKYIIHMLALLFLCHLSIAQERELTPEQKEAERQFQQAKEQYLANQYADYINYYEATLAKQAYVRFAAYKMASVSYSKLSEAGTEDSARYTKAAEEAYNQAAKWHGKKFIEERWNSFEIKAGEDNAAFTIVDQRPQYPGGDQAMYNYLGKEVVYPELARSMGVEGRVFVQFVVNKDGSLDAVHVVKGIGAGCDEEALRVVKNFPRWIPGEQDGKPVYVRMVLPIFFKLTSGSSKKKKKRRRRG